MKIGITNIACGANFSLDQEPSRAFTKQHEGDPGLSGIKVVDAVLTYTTGKLTKFKNTKYLRQSVVRNAIRAMTTFATLVWKQAFGIIR